MSTTPQHQVQAAPDGQVTRTPSRLETPSPPSRPAGWVVATMVLAAFLMGLTGFFHAVAGIVALVHDEIYVVGPRYVFALDLTAWGVIHLLVGALLLAAAFTLRRAKVWARAVGVACAGLSILVAFVFLPYYPLWAILIIAFDVLAVCALCLYSSDAAAPRTAGRP